MTNVTRGPDVERRPVAVIGAGTLGSRIALMFAAGGSDVRIVNRSPERAEAARRYVHDHLPAVRHELGLNAAVAGNVEIGTPLEDAIPGAWLVIESVAEDPQLKRQVLAEVDALADPDAIVATNSSSYPSSELIDGVGHPERVLNMHFLMPPQVNPVELMSSGRTDETIIDDLMQRLPRYGLSPYRVRSDSVGFIFNRVWAAIEREALLVVHEGAATHDEVDRIWSEVFRTSIVPFRLMDQVGLDVVLAIEEHYAEIRDGIPEGPRTLLREYLDRGQLGVKSGRGFYDDYGE